MSTMAMVPWDADANTDWCHVLEDLNGLLCSSSSSSPLGMAFRAEDCLLPIAAAPPPGSCGHVQRRCKCPVLEAASSDGAFAAPDCLSSSSALMNPKRCREDDSFYNSLYSAPPPCSDPQFPLPPLPADGALTTSHYDALLQPFSDIDLEAFLENAEEPLDQKIMAAPPAVHHPAAAAGTIHGTADGQNAGAVVVYAHQKAMAAVEDSCFRRDGASGVEMMTAVDVRNHDEQRRQASSAVALLPPPPPSLPRPRVRRIGGGERSAAPAAAKTRLDHIGFDELRKYFYMPITRAAREMNVGLTVLKKRCRELGVARWPHRKMKSLRSLMANVQEMGNGMSPVALQQELAALETYCALMEENPWIELTERTKKLRQACFKESYKRRRAAAVNDVVMEMAMDNMYSFADQHHHLHHQLPPPTASSADRHGHGNSTRFLSY